MANILSKVLSIVQDKHHFDPVDSVCNSQVGKVTGCGLEVRGSICVGPEILANTFRLT